MRGKSYTKRALAAYFRQIARQHQVTITLAALPSHVCAETLDERDYVMVRHGARTLAVYRVKPGGFLSRLKRWPKALEQRP